MRIIADIFHRIFDPDREHAAPVVDDGFALYQPGLPGCAGSARFSTLRAAEEDGY